ncbi:hypothetical protein [Deinococcus planocerae]|uniref:hypothetical protein n=1 Tax=Deinococcus planocerae TaxID=1737569 RepID=UPI000C7ED677|nr:hypothetical protein [Deinococcus planocerae]
MKFAQRPSLTLLAVGGLGVSLLTACPGPTPPYQPPVQLNFQFPAPTDMTDVRVAAIAYLGGAVNVVGLGYPTGPGTATLSLWGDGLKALAADPRCTTPFLTGEAAGKSEVTVTPPTAKTCNVYFLVFRDANRDGRPTAEEELYNTHDLYSFASEAFGYRFVSPDGRSTETGTRAAGWSLVRHLVLQPSATPDRYLVTMNSVPQADEALTIRMHEPTDYFTSQGLQGGRK